MPGLAQVQRKRAGLLDSRKNVTRIRVPARGRHLCARARRGGRERATGPGSARDHLKTEELTVPEWLSSLAGALMSHAQVSEASATALRELLT